MRALSSSALPREHDDDTQNAGGKAAERGRQPPAATRLPCTPSSHNDMNIAPNIQQLIETAAALLTALDAPNASSSSIHTPTLRVFLREARDTLTSLQHDPTAHPTINAILREVQVVHEVVKGLATPPASLPTSPRPTWAQIATSLPPTPPKSPVPSIQGPKLTIRISDAEERKNVQSLPNEAIIQRIQQERSDGKEVVAIRKLPSGDLRLFLTNERTKATLLQDRSWTACFGKTCSIAENIYKVLVHSIRIDSVDPRRAEDVESIVATLLRTEHIGLNDYLCRRRVPGYLKPDCDCGWLRQTPKHIILFCPTHMTGRAEMLLEAKTTDYTKLLSTEAGLRAVTKWFLERDILT